jgi:molecular chaperone GrpE
MQNSRLEPTHLTQVFGVRFGAESDTAALQDETARLKEENERLNQELRREHEMYLCNLAAFDNYHRRVERERAQAAQMGKRELILPLLDILDDFEQASAHADPQSADLGLHALQDRLVALLATQGVTTFDSLGTYFNPLLHEVVGTVESERTQPGTTPGTVVEVLRRGWRWEDELLRPAQVRVAQESPAQRDPRRQVQR